MVQHCQWKGAPCEKTSWEEDYTHYSKCYTFNKHGDHKLLKAGSGEWNVLKKGWIDKSELKAKLQLLAQLIMQ